MIRIGSRGSQLALWQANHIADALRALGHEVSIEIIRTTGDRMQNIAFASVGAKGMFTREIEDALLAGTIDLAVHSLKDLPTELGEPFTLAAIPQRADPRDVLVSERYGGFDALPAGAVVGTSSLRRQAQLRARRPDLEYIEFRGNVDTRLAKLGQGKADAIILAAAGLERLQKTAVIRERFAPEVLCPAPGQGALAIECRAGDGAMHAALQPLEDRDTRMAITAERRCLAALGGGCLVPIGAYCHRDGDELSLRAVVASADGRQMICAERRHTDPETLGEQAGAAVVGAGRGRHPRPGGKAGMSTAQPLAGKRILITRARHQAGRLAEALEELGAEVLRLPTIEIIPPETYAHLDAVLEVISGFDWLIVTSANGAAALADRMRFLGIRAERLTAFADGRDWSCYGGSRLAAWV